jgi:hypothetical protein
MSLYRHCSFVVPIIFVMVLAGSTRLIAEGVKSTRIEPPAITGPVIESLTSPVLAGSRFTLTGMGFTPGAIVNFFVSTAQGSVNEGPLVPASITSTSITVDVPADINLGQGVVAIQVVNTDQSYAASNVVLALLEGSASAGIPSLSAINGVGPAATSLDPRYAVANVETVVPRGANVALQGSGFDTVNGVAVDVFCACPGGKVGPFLINPGDPGLSAASITLLLPDTGPDALPVGPASFVVSNRGADGLYKRKSNALSVPIGRRISVVSVTQSGSTIAVDGTGFSTVTVINFFDSVGGKVVNLGGIAASGAPVIPITLISDTRISFAVPAGAIAGPAYVQALNPPFVPFSSSGNTPNGAFILVNPSATFSPTATPGQTPTPTSTPPAPTVSATLTVAPTPSATPALVARVLLAGGADNVVTASGSHPVVASAEIYDETTGTFSATGSMGYARFGPTLTTLDNRRILVAGGYGAFSKRPLSSAELYDIATGSFSFTGGMNTARWGHTAVLLSTGEVLVSGGWNLDFSAQNIQELYDPAVEQFALVQSLSDARMGHTATLLDDGRVLIAGGADDSGLLSSAELCNADGQGCNLVGPMSIPRQYATATLLKDGTVLVAGGASVAEIFRPLTTDFAATGAMHFPRQGHRASLLPDGRVLITGGMDQNGALLSNAEIYDPATGTFTLAPPMSIARFEHTATVLPDGKVLIAGGFDTPSDITNTAELYDPLEGIFIPTGPMTDARAGHAAAAFSTFGTPPQSPGRALTR